MMNTASRWLLALLITLFSAGIATDNLAFAQPGHSNAGGRNKDKDEEDDKDDGEDEFGDEDPAPVPFRYEITRYWEHDMSGFSPPMDLNDHGDAVVTSWYAPDFSVGQPLLFLLHEEREALYPLAAPDSDGNIDINEMVATQFEEGLLYVDDELLNDIGELRSLVTAEAINDAGQFAGEYPIDELADDGYPRWLAYRYTPPSWIDEEELFPGRLESLIGADAGNRATASISSMNNNGDVLVRHDGIFLYLDGYGLLTPDELRNAADTNLFAPRDLNDRVVNGDGEFDIQMAGQFGDEDPRAIRYTLKFDWDTETISADLLWVTPANRHTNSMQGRGINQWGDVVGYEHRSGGNWTWRAFLYKDGDTQAQFLGALDAKGSSAGSINDFGDIVGVIYPDGVGRGTEPYVYVDGVMHPLRDLMDDHQQFDRITQLRINNNGPNGLPGQIGATTGIYTDDGWVYGKILLTPYSIEQE